mgnify:CR=1 FL=1
MVLLLISQQILFLVVLLQETLKKLTKFQFPQQELHHVQEELLVEYQLIV